MSILSYETLLDYTDWQREVWRAWFARHGARALSTALGPHGDGRFGTVGEIVRHIFSAEKKYVERMRGVPLTDTTAVPTDDVEALFGLGADSRGALRAFTSSVDASRLDVEHAWEVGGVERRLTARKVLVHIVLHEVRHWAQIATLLRREGLPVDQQDFLLSPVLSPRPDQ